MKRHLTELVRAPFWTPATSGEWSCARAMARRGLVRHVPSSGFPPYELTEEGRALADSIERGE
jgi:hypothetical protein